MGKTAFLFTGQGAQYAGMGIDLYEKYGAFRKIYNETSAHLNIDLIKISSDAAELAKTNNAQAAIFALSYGIYKLLRDNGAEPDCAAGFSLGEITALAASGVLSFTDTLDLIKIRGEAMQAACERRPGAMYSIIGADDGIEKTIEEIINQVRADTSGYITPANYNCPGQIVISGDAGALEEAAKIFAEKKIRAVKLNVAGAFHSDLMFYNQEKFADFLGTLKYNPPEFDIYSNYTGKKFEFGENIKSYLIDYLPKQMSGPVRFRAELENMAAGGCGLFVEIGAGRALSGFVKRTCADAGFINIADAASLESELETIKTGA